MRQRYWVLSSVVFISFILFPLFQNQAPPAALVESTENEIDQAESSSGESINTVSQISPLDTDGPIMLFDPNKFKMQDSNSPNQESNSVKLTGVENNFDRPRCTYNYADKTFGGGAPISYCEPEPEFYCTFETRDVIEKTQEPIIKRTKVGVLFWQHWENRVVGYEEKVTVIPRQFFPTEADKNKICAQTLEQLRDNGLGHECYRESEESIPVTMDTRTWTSGAKLNSQYLIRMKCKTETERDRQMGEALRSGIY